jgi:hypothetical protein
MFPPRNFCESYKLGEPRAPNRARRLRPWSRERFDDCCGYGFLAQGSDSM